MHAIPLQNSSRAKLAVYLDELDDDPIAACALARTIGISAICLRRVWATNIGKATDDACKLLINAIRHNNLDVLAICTDDGRIPAGQLVYNQAVKRSLVIASYFRAKFFRPFAGLKIKIDNNTDDAVAAWMTAIGGECEKSALIPLLEIDHDAYAFEPAEIGALLERHKNWSLLYDPALLVVRRNQNPYIKYWSLLRNRVAAIDLHDFKIGSGFVPIGVGDCFFTDTIRDCLSNQYQGWFIIEPGVTRRIGVTATRQEITQAVIANYIQMVAQGRIAIASWTTNTKETQRGQKRS